MNEPTPNHNPSSLQVPDPKLETLRLKLIEIIGQAVAEHGPMVGHWGMADGMAGYVVRDDLRARGVGDYQSIEVGEEGALHELPREELGFLLGCMEAMTDFPLDSLDSIEGQESLEQWVSQSK